MRPDFSIIRFLLNGQDVVVFIKHIDIEGPDTFGEYFSRRGFDVQVIDLHDRGVLPRDLKRVEAVISLGGPMNVYEEEKFPFLREENSFVEKIISEKVPFMGVCLGSQSLAKACGARVGRSPEKEIGFSEVRLSQDGRSDILFEGLDETLNVFQWHEDMVELPGGATLLAASPQCPHQAFKVGPCAYGLQFHVEVTEPTIEQWIQAYFAQDDDAQVRKGRQILADYRRSKETFDHMAGRLYGNFMKIMLERGN